MSVSVLKYNKIAMAFHWTIAILVIFMLLMGESMMDVEHATDAKGPSLHVTLGIIIFVLTVIRLLWRWANPPPPLPVSMKKWEISFSKFVELTFYFLLIVIPLTGWLAFPSEVAEYPILEQTRVFGSFPVMMAPNLGLPAGAAHAILTKLTIGLVALHILAALKHQFINRDGVLGRMLPW